MHLLYSIGIKINSDAEAGYFSGDEALFSGKGAACNGDFVADTGINIISHHGGRTERPGLPGQVAPEYLVLIPGCSFSPITSMQESPRRTL